MKKLLILLVFAGFILDGPLAANEADARKRVVRKRVKARKKVKNRRKWRWTRSIKKRKHWSKKKVTLKFSKALAASLKRIRVQRRQKRAAYRKLTTRRNELRRSMEARKLFRRGGEGPLESASGLMATPGPRRYITLTKAVKLIAYIRQSKKAKQKLIMKDKQARARREKFYKKTALAPVPHEILAKLPTKFCAGAGKCFGSYDEVRNALYAPRAGGKQDLYSPPVFCAPTLTKSGWSKEQVSCHANWRETMKKQDDEYPPFACLGHPHFLNQLVDTPDDGAVNGFVCRERIFHVYDYSPIASADDQKKAVAGMCKDMRKQVWGEEIANTFTSSTGLSPDQVKIPEKLPLTREELLYFYGHRETYCRADRQGLVHRSKNAEKTLGAKTGVILDSRENWASSFTCGIPRGVVESGPFEEGVQVCAISPYTHGLTYKLRRARKEAQNLRQARLHCWKFNRPTCEELAKPMTIYDKHKKKQYVLDTIFQSDVFDFFDAHKELRRTGSFDVLTLKDLREAEKVPDIEEHYAFTDVANDEGTFGIDEFCRFEGTAKRVVCGYDRDAITQYYELHQREGGKASGCDDGVCDRGAFERGYSCAIFSMEDYFDGKPVWVCGIDQQGNAGRKLTAKARQLCLGGRYAAAFMSPKGSRSTLQCYERKFVWAATNESKKKAKLDIRKTLAAAAKKVGTEGAKLYMEFYTSKAMAKVSKVSRKYSKKGADLNTVKDCLEKPIKLFREFQAGWMNPFIRVKQHAALLKKKKDASRGIDRCVKKIGAVVGKRQAKSLDTHRRNLYSKHGGNMKSEMALLAKLESSAKSIIAGQIKQADKTYKHATSSKVKRQTTKVAQSKAKRQLSVHIKTVKSHIIKSVGGWALGFLGHRASARHHFASAAKPKWFSDLARWSKKVLLQRGKDGKKKCKDEKICEVADKIKEVADRETAAHNRWVQEFLLAAKTDEGYAVKESVLIKGVMQNILVRMLDELRSKTLSQARKYRRVVLNQAKKQLKAGKRLTRMELLETAKRDEIFCVEPKSDRKLRGVFVCSRSPLLVAGEVEGYAARVHSLAAWKSWKTRAVKRLKSFKFRFNLGKRKAKGKVVKKRSPKRRKVVKKRSPKRRKVAKKGKKKIRFKFGKFNMKKVAKILKKQGKLGLLKKVQKIQKKARLAQARRYGLRYWFSRMRQWRRQRKIDEAKEKIRKNFQSRWCYYLRSPSYAKDKSPALRKGYDSPYEVFVPKASGNRKEVAFLWLKCQGFKYIDEVWQDADRKRWKQLHKFDMGDPVDATEAKGAPAVASGGGATNDPRAAKHSKKMTSKVGGFLMKMLAMAIPELGQLTKLVKNIGKLGSGFIAEFADRIKEKLKAGPWKAAQGQVTQLKKAITDADKAIKEAQKKVEQKLNDEREKETKLWQAKVDYAGALPALKKGKQKEKKKAENTLKEAKKARVEAEKALASAKKVLEKAKNTLLKNTGKLKGKLAKISVSDILVMMADKIATMISGRLTEAIKPRARSLFTPVFKWVRSLLNPIATAVIQALAAIPFTFGALGYIGQIVYTWALGKLEELCINGLVGLIERFMSKGVRAIVSPLLSAAKPLLARMVRAACNNLPELVTGGICGQMQIAGFAPEHSWLNRAFACKHNAPRITPAMHKQAIAARFEIIREVDDMRENVLAYVRGIANPVLSKFGYSYDSWMLAFSPNGKEEDRVVAALVAPAIVEHANELAGSLHLMQQALPAASPFWPRMVPRRMVARSGSKVKAAKAVAQ